MNTEAVEVNNVSFEYEKGNEVVKDVSFSIPINSTTMLIGPNGSGKTTLLKIMVGLLLPSSGSVKVYGVEPKDNRSDTGYVPQKLYFDQTFPITVKEFLKFSYGGPDKYVFEMLENLGIRDLAGSLIGKLSGGQLQRVLIARSLLGNPKILFLDEPVSGIDMGGEQNFYDLIKEIQNKFDVTVVMVSHEVHLVSRIADQVICINKEMLCSGAPENALLPEVVEKLYGKHTSLYKHHC
ncbi:MAG: zinc ABC transporter ATP-binding protein ZnuC [Parcubacteria group bacterium CG11_big_fil_rev_8_21_14_0_20_39_22]|nr:MAG: zinc ABC transporter ATP-binding protein ZnuC [Parcubacteria group bacterium CG11_big_fil_rev_8_21_14_0_20_39_22]